MPAGTQTISIPSNSACNVYELINLYNFVEELNGISISTIFTDAAQAVYAIRQYPFILSRWRNDLAKINIYNTKLNADGFVLPRLVSFPVCEFDGRFGTSIWEELNNYRAYGDAQLFLPYIGFTSISVSDLHTHLLRVFYTIDLATGECSANIESDGVVVSVVNGTIGEDCFFANTNAAQLFKQNLTTGTATVAGTVASVAAGNYVGAAAAGVAGVASIAMNQVERTNRGQIGSAGVGRSGPQTAYIVIECYRQSEPNMQQFASLRGRPLERAVSLSGLSGYSEFADVHLNVPNALEDEKAELEGLLKSGVIL